MKRFRLLYTAGLSLAMTCSCKRVLEVPLPGGSLSTSVVYADDVSAQSAMRGVYANMVNALAPGPWSGGISGPLGICADELTLPSYSPEQQQFFENNLQPPNSMLLGAIWSSCYNYIYQSNAVYEGVRQSPGVTPAAKDQLMGQAMLMRALCHYTLVTLFDSVPLAVTSDYRANALLKRSSPADVYVQIVKDLQFAADKIDESNIAPALRNQPTKWSAIGLLAKVQLQQHHWKEAEDAATAVLAKRDYRLDTLGGVFNSGTPEAIWSLSGTGVNIYSVDGSRTTGGATSLAYRMSPYLVALFQSGDKRLTKWARAIGGFTGPYKYKTLSNTQAGAKAENTMILRVADMYLIRAEARAQQNNLAGAIQDVDSIRIRAGAADAATQAFQTIRFSNPGISQQDLLTVIYNEDLLEFFSEFGHRWLDARRAQPADISLFFGTRKPGITAADNLFPIPQYEITNNPNLTQNAGYK